MTITIHQDYPILRRKDKKLARIVELALASIEARLLDRVIIGNGYHCMAESGFITGVVNGFRRFLHGKGCGVFDAAA